MIIQKIQLKNVRSYLDAEITFPPGSVLLSGDIGSGKSTILYAIEFALFGIRRDLPGSALLREGKNNGHVELTFQLDDKKISIKRTLKRSKETVNQSSGILTINKNTRELTPTELTAEILNLLGYPPELLTRKKSQLYRYTVYTPQEQMKQILLFEEEIRYDTLRKVFGIDKYKRIKENADELLRELRSKNRELSTLIESLLDIEDKRRKSLAKKAQLEKDIKAIREELSRKKDIEKEKVEALEKIESALQEFHEIEKELQAKKAERKSLRETLPQDNKNLKTLEDNLLNLRKKIEAYQLEKPSLSEKEMEKKIIELEEAEENWLKKNSKLEEKVTELEDILREGTCPLCEQAVSDKEKFRQKISKKINEKEKSEAKLKNLRIQIKQLKNLQEEIRKYQEKIKEKENLEERIREMEKQLSSLREQVTEKTEKIKKLREETGELHQKLPHYQNLETKKREVNSQLEKIRQEKIGIERKEASLQQEFVDNENQLKEIEEQLKKKVQAKESQQKLNQFQIWLKDYFINLMSTMETHVMINIQRNFNLLFQDWFNKLVEDRAINVRIDERFSPIIEQNGYGISYEYLSGGERTSVALAYRLSLNKIINTLTKEIKTKDLLILDEPTDGFSTAQMDSIRAILEELGTKQTIIVSHEPKIESFVENVIHLEKKNHQSVIK